ncbi:MAG TPA: EamA family transporter, partial [Actinomycetota bacterium]|nr:EamA family transporter [Actinomycetota bacterium]
IALGERVTWREAVGIGIGFGGIVLLVDPFTGGGFDPLGIGLLLIADLSWAAGSLYARRAPMPSRSLVGAAMQMLAGGLALGIAGIVAGELADVELRSISTASVLALVYLTVFGSLVAFTAYAWLIRVARTSLVATYAYVNPVVALLLGWAFLSEPLGRRTLLAAGVILIGVALIVTARAGAPEEGAGRRPVARRAAGRGAGPG